MKRFSLLIYLVLFCTFSNAQDTIVKRDGVQILSKIIEISSTEVKFKKFDFQDGPDFIENKSDIRLIKYSNGTKEEFKTTPAVITAKPDQNNSDYYTGPINLTSKIEANGTRFRHEGRRINERELHRVLLSSNDQQINLLVNRANRSRKLQFVGLGGLAFGAVGAVSLALGTLFNETGFDIFAGVCAAGAIACPIAAITFKHKRNVSNTEAIKLYNAKF